MKVGDRYIRDRCVSACEKAITIMSMTSRYIYYISYDGIRNRIKRKEMKDYYFKCKDIFTYEMSDGTKRNIICNNREEGEEFLNRIDSATVLS